MLAPHEKNQTRRRKKKKKVREGRKKYICSREVAELNTITSLEEKNCSVGDRKVLREIERTVAATSHPSTGFACCSISTSPARCSRQSAGCSRRSSIGLSPPSAQGHRGCFGCCLKPDLVLGNVHARAEQLELKRVVERRGCADIAAFPFRLVSLAGSTAQTAV